MNGLATKEYEEGDEFWEITFQIPKDKEIPVWDDGPKIEIKERVFNEFGRDVFNLTVIPGSVYKDSPSLRYSMNDHSYTVWNAKHPKKVEE